MAERENLMRICWILFIPMLLLACGTVQSPDDPTDPDLGSCSPGARLSCEGNDLIVCAAAGANERIPCDNGCNSDTLVCNCESESSVCSESIESQCGPDGAAIIRSCTLGCFDDNRCADILPSNRLAQFVDDLPDSPALELPDASTINTTDGTFTIDGLEQSIPTFLLQAPENGVPVRVFVLRSFRITGQVTVTGFPGFAVLSREDIVLDGVLRARAGGGPDGRGDGGGFLKCSDSPARAQLSGMGGGGYGQPGGKGGDATSGPVTGGAGGEVVGNPQIVPLRGGGHNAGVTGGGGAVQFTSLTGIRILSGGINAGGGGGADNAGGGGAGGGILLEAPTVALAANAALAANGGGGGCGTSGTVIQSAESGRMDLRPAAGCTSTAGNHGGAGGVGVPGQGHGLPGLPIAGCGVSAGTGGGGVGRIRVNTIGNSFEVTPGAIVSPPASLGSLGTQ